MEVRAKKALGQHFLTDQKVARAIVDALETKGPVLEVGPGMGVLTQYLLEREDIDLKLVEIDTESVEYLLTHFQGMQGRLMEADLTTSPHRFSSRSWTTRTTFRRLWVWFRRRLQSALQKSPEAKPMAS